MAKNNILSSFFLVFLTLFLLFGESCLKSKRPGIPEDVVDVLDMSGIHKPQLTKFILKCMQSDDSLKMDAAFFLISNLHRNYTPYYSLTDSSGQSFIIKPDNYENYHSIRLFLDSLENEHGRLLYRADSFEIDYAKTDCHFLWNKLKTSFELREKNKSYLNYDFETFKKYILPFKVASEQIDSFNLVLYDTFSGLIDTNKTTISNIKFINDEINKLVEYDERYVKNQLVQAPSDLLEKGKGNLSDINILKVKILRSLGYASVMDYTPYIVDSSGWYSWTTVINPDGEEYNLDISKGVLSNLLDNRIAKVYRRTYFEDTNSLFAIKNIKHNTPPYLGHFNYFDVTNKYLPTYDYEFNNISPDKYLYLAVYNDGNWRPIDWALNSGNKALYTGIGNALYLNVEWNNKKIKSIGQPFEIINGSITEYIPSNEFLTTTLHYSSRNIKINLAKKYRLFYWDEKWIEIEFEKKNKNSIKASVPQNSILLLTDDDGLYDERIFTIEEGKQRFF